jgi:hypothetical protein
LDNLKPLLDDLEKIKDIHIEKNPFKVFSKPEIVEALKLIEEYSEEFKI